MRNEIIVFIDEVFDFSLNFGIVLIGIMHTTTRESLNAILGYAERKCVRNIAD